MLTTFVYLNYVRQTFLVLTFGVALHALGLLYKMSGSLHPSPGARAGEPV
jgi:hypothetical protein